jgi:adenylate kinase
MRLIFLGPPGAGKGTLSAKAKDLLNIPHVSTGDIFRAAIKNETALGLKVKAIVEEGGLVPDELTIALVKEKLTAAEYRSGYILDGFPRTVGQAEALATFSQLDQAINFVLSDGDVMTRLSGRRLCKNCGAIYHSIFNPPKTAGVCDKCGGEVYQREDDKPVSINQRLIEYKKQTEPLIQYYKDKGILKDIDASVKPEEVLENLKTLLGVK